MTQPFFFGESNKRLFAFYHPPQKQCSGKAILLCYPVGQEYLRVYRSYRLLASRLSANGAHVLRFDYFGTGDSSGTNEQSELKHWLNDIDLAIEQLKSKSGLSRVSIVGLRLGATLAAKACTERNDIDHLICWEPVVDGKIYIDDLQTTHAAMLKDPDRFYKARTAEECESNELIGFLFSDKLLAEIKTIDKTDLLNAYCDSFNLINASNNDGIRSLSTHRLVNSSEIQYNQFETDLCWSDINQIETTFAPQEIIGHITKKLTK